MGTGRRQRLRFEPRAAWALLACLALGVSPARGQGNPQADAAKVSAWATGGASATARPGDAGGGSSAAADTAQATPWPAYVIQGGTIPPNWQPRPIPINGIGPDGRPTVHYYAPTYTFTYAIGPPVVAAHQAAYRPPQAYQFPAGPPPYAPNYAAPTGMQSGPTQPFPAPLPPPVSPQATPPAIAGYAPSAAPAVPQPPQTWGPSSESAAGWAAAPAGQQPPPPAAIAMPVPPVVPVMPPTGVPPSVPVPATVSALPVSSGGMAPAAAPSSRAANSHLWRVVKVYDGDTVTCLDDMNQQQKVRLAGIDAPEAGQDFGQVSRQALAGMVFGKTIEVVDDGRDRYGRWVGRLYTDGIDVNQQMVATGNAWHYAAYSKDPALAAAQSQAQAQGLGLWSQPNPTPPWEYRKTEKSR